MQCVGKEFISTMGPDMSEGSFRMRYDFLAINPGRATLIFEYGYDCTDKCQIKDVL